MASPWTPPVLPTSAATPLPPIFRPAQGLIQSAGGPYYTTGFLTKVNPGGGSLAFSTYLGGQQTDNVSAVAIDSLGDAYVTGSTTSGNFPTTLERI